MVLSETTIPLSTNIPSAIISAAREIWSKPIEKFDITIMESNMVIGMRLETIKPVRNPRVISITAVTTAIACSRFDTNPLTLSSTSLGEKLTKSNSMPRGYTSLNPSILAMTALPRAILFPPSRMAIAMPIAGLPFTRTSSVAGST